MDTLLTTGANFVIYIFRCLLFPNRVWKGHTFQQLLTVVFDIMSFMESEI